MRFIACGLVVLAVTIPCIAQVCVPAPYGIISWYPAEGNAVDVIGGNSGSLLGGAYGPGAVRQAFGFAGLQSDGINLGDVPSLDFTGASSFSIEAWVKVNALAVAAGNDGQVIVSLNYRCNLPSPDTVATETLAIQAGTGKAFFQVRDAGGNQALILTPNAIPIGQWIHLVGVRDASCLKVRLYLNGTPLTPVVDPTSGRLWNTGPDFIGRRWPCATNNPFNGSIDEVSIYNRALTDCEVAALYNAACAGKCRPGACPSSPCGC
jgi:hypothetical protein